ncbi:hypothetical protein [Ferruginibacter sp. HRS2-29]|uniref:hypothetical protein n=1 Tax=Ferruginibacter sp. HRS2-29 TaxID=2487334 RepID=UPI0020CD3660|nr:hypothetical protein [Ferruginibacter sp. HRS2-29]MCP9749632.1 hypothetical protein [Ferruginibacter sp. HRS2-29]
MKATYFKAARFIAIVFAAVALVSNPVSAGTPGEDTVEKPLVVTYLGTVNAQPLFQVDLNNASADDLTLVLENEAGDVLYTQKIKETSFTKKIQLDTNETEINLNLYVYSAKNKTKQVYQINKITRVVDDVVVNQRKN